MRKKITAKNVFKNEPRVTVQATFTEAALSQLREYHKFEKMAGWSNLTEDEYIGNAASLMVYKWMQETNAAVKLAKDEKVKMIIERDKMNQVLKETENL
jgi:hypothetical protein